MQWIVNNPDGYATSLKSFAGGTLTLTNNSATDVYYDVEMGGSGLNGTAPGVVPVGSKIAASGGVVQFQDAPRDLWVRAASQTTLLVQSDAGYAGKYGVKQTVFPGGFDRRKVVTNFATSYKRQIFGRKIG